MTLLQAILLGFVQAFTEFLPISSSGHLILVREFLGVEGRSLFFDVGVHVATLAAVISVLWNDIVKIARDLFSQKWKHSLGFKILVATIPAGMVGILLTDQMLSFLRTTHVVAYSLIVWGIVLYATDVWMARKPQVIDSLLKIGWMRVMIIGIAQALALIPGTSRSGITMSAAMAMGIDRPRAARFSFLLSIPAIAGAGLLTSIDGMGSSMDIAWISFIAGCTSAFIFGLLAIRLLLGFVERFSFLGFTLYRVILGLVLLFLFT